MHRTFAVWRAIALIALLISGPLGMASAFASETWAFVDGSGVLHMGNAATSAKDDSGVADTSAKPGTPDFVAERGLTWINHTWRMRYLAYDPTAVVSAPIRAAAAAPAPRTFASGLRLPRGLEAARPYLENAARTHAVDPALVVAVAAAESAFNPEAVSHKGALGLMQIMPATAERYGVARPASPNVRHAVLEPQVNAAVGSRYLADLLRLFGGDKTLALAAYNAGEGAVAKYGNRVPPYPETQQYVEKVLRYYQALTQ